jgi:L-ascorbate metabolism protein UlaG (beta-lactamase superfamily)
VELEYLLNEKLETIKPGHQGNIQKGGRFLNYQKVAAPKLKDILRWKTSKNPQQDEKRNDDFRLGTLDDPAIFDRSRDKVVWLGHASFLLTLNGVNILLDPVFADIPLVKRRAKIPFQLKDYDSIDYVLISHAHYDHLDKKTVRNLARINPNLKIYCGLGTAELLQKKWRISNTVIEAGWYQKFPLFADGVEIYFMPALHWSNRSLRDRNLRLWGSFVIRGKNSTIYFMGDSGYSPHFKEIGQLIPGIDYAILGVGAYMPRNIMQYSHINPEEAKQAYHDLGAKYLLPMHYATYDLTDEPYSEPLKKIQALFIDERDRLKDIGIGEILNLKCI